MMSRTNDKYFEWLYELVCEDRFAKGISFKKLLWFLYTTEFVFSIPMDANRAADGISLRQRYPGDISTDEPCSVLEMMVALSIRIEETMMDDPQIGDRTTQWFWTMIVNLGLGAMYDTRYNMREVSEKIRIFLDREYEPDGRGGLFYIEDCRRDVTEVEIWYQACWYIDSIYF